MKVILAIDVSPFAYQTVHSLCGYNGKNLKAERKGKFLQEEGEKERFLAVMDANIKDVVDAIPNIVSKIIFVFDPPSSAKSWRYELFADYKSDRKLEERMYDGKSMVTCFERYKEFLEKSEFITTQVDFQEADDIISYISTYDGEENDDVIIISPDSDLKQLVKTRGENAPNNVFFYDNGKQQIVVDHKFNTVSVITSSADDEMGSFFGDLTNDDDISDFFSAAVKINPNTLVISKIMAGDKSDSIPACATFVRGTQTHRLTEKRVDKVWDALTSTSPEPTLDWEYISKTLLVEINEGLKTKKVSEYFPDKEIFRENYERNKTLIKLTDFYELVDLDLIEEVVNIMSTVESDPQGKFLSVLIKDVVGVDW